MQRFRAFTSAECNDDLAALERAINEWLKTDQPHIHYFSQSSLGAHLIISFVYAEPPAGHALAEAEATVTEVFERTYVGDEPATAGRSHVPLPQVELPY
ncbi:MAG: hypothetical protein ACHQ4H_01120 [Ktedonobacterales bacterium]|jgi:hypothetical protein